MLCASTFGTKPKAKSPQSLWVLANKRSEYSDEIGKLNKKEDMLLARQLKVLDRQERVAQSILRKHKREAERLRTTVSDRTQQSINLRQYDKKRMLNKVASHRDSQHVAMAGVRLPPLWGAKVPVTSKSKAKVKSQQPREKPGPNIMMSMRALRTGVLDIEMDTMSEPNRDRRQDRIGRDDDDLVSDRTVHSIKTV